MSDDSSNHQRAMTERTARFPYSPSVYVRRVLWAIVYATVWKIAFKRNFALRSTIVRAFGGQLSSLTVNFARTCWIEMP